MQVFESKCKGCIVFAQVSAVAKDILGDQTKRLLLLRDFSDVTVENKLDSDLMDKTEPYELQLDYSYWTAEEVLRATLPDVVPVPSAFELVGHIAHMNLREEHEPYKHLIGQVILDKNPSLRTIVNKVGEIENTFRVFNMEVIAGESDFIAQVKEGTCTFRFDFSKVYWNSRLQAEHSRLVSLFNSGDSICDVFCGVGPFAIPAAKKGCTVYANDLNPESIKFLRENIKINKISSSRIKVFNIDGSEFIKQTFNLSNENNSVKLFDHYIMNLPAISLTFLESFKGLLDDSSADLETLKLPKVHCYFFSRKEDPKTLVESALNHSIDDISIHYVRSVAPNKDMICASFEMPKGALYGKCKKAKTAIEVEK